MSLLCSTSTEILFQVFYVQSEANKTPATTWFHSFIRQYLVIPG